MDNPAPDVKKEIEEDKAALRMVNEACQFGIDNLARIDKDKDGYLTKNEMNAAIAGGAFQGKELKQLKALAENVDQIQKVVHNGWGLGSDTNGASKKDLQELQNWSDWKYKQIEDYAVFSETFKRLFKTMDTNQDKKLSAAEVKRATTDYNLPRIDRLNLADALQQTRISSMTENFFDERLKETRVRNGFWRSALVWSMADSLRK